MRIHFIAIGGAAMHNLALALQKNGHQISGSDDEIYNPARDRLAAAGLLPEPFGWFAERITPDLDAIVLGMHARADNPELLRAQSLGLPVYSYPEFIYRQSLNKKRFVVAGSHGKTTTTAMAMHVLRKTGMDFDYLVGAQVQGFDTMVRLSDAPALLVEGDEYFASPLDHTPKMVRFRPHHAVLTGIAWDHINVFPSFDTYCAQFNLLLEATETGGSVIWYAQDPEIQKLIEKSASKNRWNSLPFMPFEAEVEQGRTLVAWEGRPPVALQIFGTHNLLNARAASLICREFGIPEYDFLLALSDFKGAAKRLQLLARNDQSNIWLDFAHAPSKVKATVAAVKEQYPDRPLTACLELHTFSSLNRDFLPQYQGSLDQADEAAVYFSPHTLEMKKMPPLDAGQIRQNFQHPRLQVFTDSSDLSAWLNERSWQGRNLLLMSSGTFDGLDARALAERLIQS